MSDIYTRSVPTVIIESRSKPRIGVMIFGLAIVIAMLIIGATQAAYPIGSYIIPILQQELIPQFEQIMLYSFAACGGALAIWGAYSKLPSVRKKAKGVDQYLVGWSQQLADADKRKFLPNVSG